jgi:hypothetical protein
MAESPGHGRERPRQRRPVLRCDFCGEPAASVRRVALDGDYDRLQVPHRELYACPACSERKERARTGLAED